MTTIVVTLPTSAALFKEEDTTANCIVFGFRTKRYILNAFWTFEQYLAKENKKETWLIFQLLIALFDHWHTGKTHSVDQHNFINIECILFIFASIKGMYMRSVSW